MEKGEIADERGRAAVLEGEYEGVRRYGCLCSSMVDYGWLVGSMGQSRVVLVERRGRGRRKMGDGWTAGLDARRRAGSHWKTIDNGRAMGRIFEWMNE